MPIGLSEAELSSILDKYEITDDRIRKLVAEVLTENNTLILKYIKENVSKIVTAEFSRSAARMGKHF